MKEYDFEGDYFLPGSEKKFPGRLEVDKENKRIKLEIFAQETIEGNAINNILDYENQRYHSMIIGDCMGNVTLYNCSWAATQKIGKGLYQIDYKAEFLFHSVQIKDSNFLVKSATFVFPYLASWYDGWDALGKINLDNRAEFGISAQVEKENNDSVHVSQNLTITVFDKINRRMVEVGVHHSIKYQKYISFNYKNPIQFQETIHDASTFCKLLELVHSKPVLYKMVFINVPKNFISKEPNYILSKGDDIEVHITNYSLNRGKDVNQHRRHQNYILLSRWNCSKEELKEVIIKWFSNERLYNVYDYYLDSNNWFQESHEHISNVMFNNKFLNLIQGLEDYYRKCINQGIQDEKAFIDKKGKVLSFIKDAELKKWVNDNFKPSKHVQLEEKIQIILNDIKPIFLETITNHPFFISFPRYAKDKRNELSHGKNKETYQGEEFELYFFITQIILGICILKSLGVLNINKKIQNYNEWIKNLHEILNYKKEDNN
jgi:hypothetical protein